ncbi:hypothetical protein HII31_10532 [Pseudocercospora fuligena]|uniref:BTB domain-containing protein n=1 Tax=Pseudocercospora fuligena TaxID=685502 RepID=A0A8H6VF55_9PEZI|nr:hypothetical protein HII31_10532 [Pseudocercospora fuligena]
MLVFLTTDAIAVASHVKAASIPWHRSEPFSWLFPQLSQHSSRSLDFLFGPRPSLTMASWLNPQPLVKYGDEEFADFTIICGSKAYRVHRIIICAKSKYFKRACSGAFTEASKQKIELKEDPPEAVECMIQYFYDGNYDDCSGLIEHRNGKSTMPSEAVVTVDISSGKLQFPMQLDAWVYAVAEKLMPTLKDLAYDKFKECARVMANPRTRLLTTADTVYEHLPLPEGDQKLHELLVDAWVVHAGTITKDNESGERANLSNILESIPKFAADVAVKFMSGFNQNRMWVSCIYCPKKKEIAQEPREVSTVSLWEAPACTDCRGGHVPEDGKAVILGNVTINKFWPYDRRGEPW